MSMNEEERQARLAEVIEMGEELFEMALVSQEQVGKQDAENGAKQVLAENVGEMRKAAETFFHVLRKLVVSKESAEG
jgi:hypothetical protein